MAQLDIYFTEFQMTFSEDVSYTNKAFYTVLTSIGQDKNQMQKYDSNLALEFVQQFNARQIMATSFNNLVIGELRVTCDRRYASFLDKHFELFLIRFDAIPLYDPFITMPQDLSIIKMTIKGYQRDFNELDYLEQATMIKMSL